MSLGVEVWGEGSEIPSPRRRLFKVDRTLYREPAEETRGMVSEALAYPVLLLAVYGASRAGAAFRGRALAWAWALLTAVLVGVVIAVHVRLAVAGLIRTPFQVTITSLGLGAIFVAVGIHVHMAFGVPSRAPAVADPLTTQA